MQGTWKCPGHGPGSMDGLLALVGFCDQTLPPNSAGQTVCLPFTDQ